VNLGGDKSSGISFHPGTRSGDLGLSLGGEAWPVVRYGGSLASVGSLSLNCLVAVAPAYSVCYRLEVKRRGSQRGYI